MKSFPPFTRKYSRAEDSFKGMRLILGSDGRQREQFPKLSIEHFADEILLMQSLHHYDDDAILSLLFSRLSRVLKYHSFADFATRLSDSASSGFRMSSRMMMSAPRPVSTPPTEVDSRNPCAVVMNSFDRLLLLSQHGSRKESAIQLTPHERSAISGMFVGQFLPIASADDLLRGVVAQEPGWEGYACSVRFQSSRWQIDDQTLRLPVRHFSSAEASNSMYWRQA